MELSNWDKHVKPMLDYATNQGEPWFTFDDELDEVTETGRYYLSSHHRIRLENALLRVPESYLNNFCIQFDESNDNPGIVSYSLGIGYDIDSNGIAVYVAHPVEGEYYFRFKDSSDDIVDIRALNKFAELLNNIIIQLEK